MQSVGVIGAGQMGAGIAQVSAQAGYRVLLADVSRDRAEAGKAGIGKQLERLVAKEKIDAAARDAALALIEPVDGPATMGGCRLVIEAATEREKIKRRIFADVGAVARGGRDPRQQHLLHPDHPGSRRRRPIRHGSWGCIFSIPCR